jgi:hypothetical protein
MQSRATAVHAVAMPSRARFTTAAVGLTAASIGLVTWVATMATAPRYSYGPDHDTGEPTYYFLLLPLAALAIGLVAPSRAWLLRCTAGATWPDPLAMDRPPRRQRWTLGPDRPPTPSVRGGPDGNSSGWRLDAIPLPTRRQRPMEVGQVSSYRVQGTGGIRYRPWSSASLAATVGATADCQLGKGRAGGLPWPASSPLVEVEGSRSDRG